MTSVEAAGIRHAPHHGDRLTRGETTHASKRIVHVGVGAFHRAHQAWYTARAEDGCDWGITAFTGRSSTIADRLSPQGGLYTLIERGPEHDRFSHVGSIHAVIPGSETGQLAFALADAATAVVTLTITEAGYRLTAAGEPDLQDSAVRADIEILTDLDGRDDALDAGAGLQTVLGRLVFGFELRRRSGAGPLAVVPCDNIPDNGGFVAHGIAALANAVSQELRAWVDSHVSFVSTSVDRITPRVTAEDELVVLQQTGWTDASPVVAEPFSNWVLCGCFPAGRPRWETAGATFVEHIEPYEARKLWMLNGAHTLLAFQGQLAGHDTVSDAIRDPRGRAAVNELWDAAVRHLPVEMDLPAYRTALLERFGNPRLDHRLDQIAEDGLTKLRLRIVPIAMAELRAGRDARACAFVVAVWIRTRDAALNNTDPPSLRQLVSLVDSELAASPPFMQRVEDALASIDA